MSQIINVPKIVLGTWAWGNDGAFGKTIRKTIRKTYSKKSYKKLME
jgi:hypothetical protein